MTNKQKIILGSVIGLLAVGCIGSIGALIGGAVGNRGGGSYGAGNGVYGEGGQNGNATERDNMIILAKRYMERGEYERAMNILDNLLIKDATDEEALNLMDDVISLRGTNPSGSSSTTQDSANG